MGSGWWNTLGSASREDYADLDVFGRLARRPERICRKVRFDFVGWAICRTCPCRWERPPCAACGEPLGLSSGMGFFADRSAMPRCRVESVVRLAVRFLRLRERRRRSFASSFSGFSIRIRAGRPSERSSEREPSCGGGQGIAGAAASAGPHSGLDRGDGGLDVGSSG